MSAGSGPRGGLAAEAAPALGAAWLARAALALAGRPSLWSTAVRQALALARPGWWHRRPFLPLPAPEYVRFRLQAAYGGRGDAPPPPADLVTYLNWCRRARRWGR